MTKKNCRTERYHIVDGIRGFALCNMIVYHAVWDLVYIFGFNWNWYRSGAAYAWQQAICWTFIFLSGFCCSLGHRTIKRGVTVFLAGLLVTLATILFMPQERVLFGILTLLGSCMLLLIPLECFFNKCSPIVGFLFSFAAFIVTRNINEGYLGFESWNFLRLPDFLYRNLATAFLGFPPSDFYSTDYFSLFPWIFLFAAGYFIKNFLDMKKLMKYLRAGRMRPLEWLGRNSLVVYLIHQPCLYFVFNILF